MVLFDPYIGPNQVLPLQVRVYLGVMKMKGYSTFPKVPALLEPHHQIVLCRIQDTCRRGGYYSSTEMQSVYFIAPADWQCVRLWGHIYIYIYIYIYEGSNKQKCDGYYNLEKKLTF